MGRPALCASQLMQQIDFYILSETAVTDEPARLACRLAEKAWQSGHRVFIHTASSFEAQKVDDLLWTFRQDSFVPHGMYSEPLDGTLPVLVGDGVEPRTQLDVLINLTEDVPSYFERCARIVEVIGASEEARARGRARYRFYRDRGCSLESHKL